VNKYVVVKRVGYARPVWQVIVRATGGVATTHGSRKAAVRAAKVMNEKAPS
jgi:hypothetical protein